MSRSVWMLGVCGMGMGPLAIYLKSAGWDVYGWDDSTGSPMECHLSNAEISLLHDPWSVGRRPSIVGRSSAIKLTHPALALAHQHGVSTPRRGELLAEIVSQHRFVAVCGSHGKTTTCGMIVTALAATGIDFGYVLGGLFRDATLPPARASESSPWVVAEVDESDGTISAFSPDITVAVNLDWDHPDYYRDEAALEGVFRALFERTRTAVIIPAGNARLEHLTSGLRIPVFRVGPDAQYSYQLLQANQGSSIVALKGLFPSAEYHLPVAGSFNQSNAALALAVTHNITGNLPLEPLARWRGIRRRQDVLFERKGLRILADYAHHPTEIEALLHWIRETHKGRIIAVFQPHRHTRTRQYAREFRQALSVADYAFVLPVYAAGEEDVHGCGSGTIVADSTIVLVPDRSKLPTLIDDLVRDEEAVVAFIGAGDIERDAEVYATILRKRSMVKSPSDFSVVVRKRLSTQCILKGNEPLAGRTTLGIGGSALWYAEPTDVADITELLRAAAEMGLPWFVVGRGSNLFVPSEGYDGLVLHLDAKHWGSIVDCGEGRFRVGGGTKLKELCAVAARGGWAGFEFLEGIPGTIGGSLRMNAGALGNWIFDVVDSVEWMTSQGRVHSAHRNGFEPLYRDCPQLHGTVVLSAVLQAKERNEPSVIRARMDELASHRRTTQPREASAGCVFRNPQGDKAGRLIDLSRLKGRSVGAVKVSSIHANFLVNSGEASAADFLSLMRIVRAEVKALQGVELQPEIIALGQNWQELL